MKILFLSELFYPQGGGAELATYLYAKFLCEAGFTVTVVTNRLNIRSRPKIRNLVYYSLPLLMGEKSSKYSVFGRLDILFSKLLRRLIKWADVIYIPRLWYSAIPYAKFLRKPVIVHLHDYFPLCPLSNFYDTSSDTTCSYGSRFCRTKCIYIYELAKGRSLYEVIGSVALNSTLGKLLGMLVGYSDAVICVSDSQKNVIVRKFPSLDSRIHVIYNPFIKTPYMEAEGNDFGYFGGPNYLKGFNILIRAMSHINKDYQESINVQATNFPGRKWTTKSLRPRYIHLYDHLNPDQFESIYEGIRAVIVPSIWLEPAPYVVIEALMRGRLIIASQIGGIPEQVKDCPGVFLHNARDHEKLAENLLYVKNLNRDIATDMGMKNRERILSRFSNKRSINEFARILEKVCK